MTSAGTKKGMAKAVGRPLVQFLVLGVVFYALYAWLGASEPRAADKVIHVTSTDVSRLDAGWRARWNRAPTEDELLALVQAHVREVALYRHAVAMGLDQDDAVIRRMLGQKLQSLAQGLVELSLSPTEDGLRAYFDAHTERYQAPDVITFTQLFFDPDKRGDATLEDAERVKAELLQRAQPTGGEGLEQLGDGIMLQRYYPQKDPAEIARFFGQGFTQSVFELSPGEWHGPVLSGYGVHLVYVHHLERSPPPEFETVRERVESDWMDDKRRELNEAYVKEVLASYDVVFDEDSPSGTADMGTESSE